MGYPKETCGYYFYHLEDQKVFVAKRAVFLEKEHILGGDSGRMIELSEVGEPSSSTTLQPESVQVSNTQVSTLRRSDRVSHPPERYVRHIRGADVEDIDPQTYEEAIMSIDSGKWQEAMNSEMDSMYSNKVWNLVDAPEGIVPIGCKWIFKKKIGVDGKVETYKARLVAKGYRQRQGVDYDETFSPVAMLKSIRILLAIAAHYDYEIWQMDVKTAFLNGNLEEEVYMMQPEGFVSKNCPDKVCRLLRSIYGLKQASRSWNIRFDEAIRSYDFVKNEDEPCVYRKVSGSAISFLVLYVDDILIIGNDIGMLSTIKAWLSRHFSMKDLGEASYILGIRIYRDRSKRMLGLSQSRYIETIVKRFGMENSKRGLIPMRHGISLSTSMSPKTAKE